MVLRKSSLQIQMPSLTGAFSPRLLGNEKRMRSEIVKMKMISRAQTKITDGPRRMMGNYRRPRRSGKGVRISWFQGLMRGLLTRMKRGMIWRRKLRMGKKRARNHRHLMQRIICRRVTVTNYNIQKNQSGATGASTLIIAHRPMT
jgi:hypothetical protein